MSTSRTADELELLPSKERKRFERESSDARRRGERRARTRALDEMLALCELWLRDALCIGEGAAELVHAVDRLAALEEDAREIGSERLRDAIALVQDTRLALVEKLPVERDAHECGTCLPTRPRTPDRESAARGVPPGPGGSAGRRDCRECLSRPGRGPPPR